MKFNNDNKINQTVFLTGLSLLLAAALIVSLIIINMQLVEKLNNLQAATQSNYNRLTQIENFLNQQIQAAQNSKTNQPATSNTEKTPAADQDNK